MIYYGLAAWWRFPIWIVEGFCIVHTISILTKRTIIGLNAIAIIHFIRIKECFAFTLYDPYKNENMKPQTTSTRNPKPTERVRAERDMAVTKKNIDLKTHFGCVFELKQSSVIYVSRLRCSVLTVDCCDWHNRCCLSYQIRP